MSIKYNEGGTTGSIGEQLTDFHYSKFAVEEAQVEKTFSQKSAKMIQPKNYGETFKCYREIPIIHDLNINSEGIDPFGEVLKKGKWYTWDIQGVRTEHNDEVAAKTAMNNGGVRIMNGDGNLAGNHRDFSVQNGAIPSIPEEGGVINQVGMTREVISAKISDFGITMSFTQKMLDMDTEPVLRAKFSKALGEAQGQMRERQIRNGLISAGMDNAVYGGPATSVDTLDADCNITYGSLRLLEQTLDLDLVPHNSTILTGSNFTATTPVPSCRWMYVPYELKSSLEDMKDTHGKKALKELHEYADQTSYIDPQEFGSIGRFRFILVHDMPIFKGGGKAVDPNDAKVQLSTNDRYDGLITLVVGDDSYGVLNLAGDVARVISVLPKPDVYNDRYGKKGAISISWYFGIIIKRPERIKAAIFTAPVL